MVKLCTAEYPLENNAKYHEHFDTFPFPLSDFQKYAIEGLINNKNVLITAHTGSGKTLPAEFAIEYFHKKGKKLIYTSPIKALSNQKFHEFSIKFPHINFGILTGDIKFNPNADVLIMTTEILQNTLFLRQSKLSKLSKQSNTNLLTQTQTLSSYTHFEMDIDNELACVVFDEVHYINDEDRGKVWEQTMMLLPYTVQMLMLSATIDKPDQFAKWIETQHIDTDNKDIKECYLIPTNHRIVPLYHYIYMDSNKTIFKTIKDKDKHKEFNSIIRKLHPIKSANTPFNDNTLNQINKFQRILDNHRCFIKPNLVLNNLLLHLKDNDMLPAICFVFSRKNVEKYAQQITANLLEDDTNIPAIAARECNNILRKLPNYNEIIQLQEFHTVVSLLEKGIAIHHSGITPVIREMIEIMFAKGFVKVLFATETFAVGINMPTKTVIFTSLSKYTSRGQRYLHSHEYTQMAGRAGRRGLDTQGHVIHCYNMFNNNTPTITEYKDIMNGQPQTLKSKFQIDYPLILNITKSVDCDFKSYTHNSMLNREFEHTIIEQTKSFQTKQFEYEQIINSSQFSDILISSLHDYRTAETNANLMYGNKRKKALNNLDKYKEDITKMIDGKHTMEEVWENFNLRIKLKKELAEQEQYLYNLENYLLNQSNNILSILHHYGFVSRNDGESNNTTTNTNTNTNTNTSYEITEKGIIASSIREVPSILFAQLICDNKFDNLSVDEFITFLSCFNDIKFSDECCIYNMDDIPIHVLSSNVREILRETQTLIETFCCEEDKRQLFTGEFDVKIQLELIPYVVKWLKADNEKVCLSIITELGENIGVFLGDFTKTLLKINNISNELFQVFTERNNIKLAHMVSQISERIMKFVVTNQSLYV